MQHDTFKQQRRQRSRIIECHHNTQNRIVEERILFSFCGMLAHETQERPSEFKTIKIFAESWKRVENARFAYRISAGIVHDSQCSFHKRFKVSRSPRRGMAHAGSKQTPLPFFTRIHFDNPVLFSHRTPIEHHAAELSKMRAAAAAHTECSSRCQTEDTGSRSRSTGLPLTETVIPCSVASDAAVISHACARVSRMIVSRWSVNAE